MLYGSKAQTLSHYLKTNGDSFEALVHSLFAAEEKIASENLDIQHRVANHFVPLLVAEFYPEKKPWMLTFNAFQSNLFHFAAVLHLIRRGMIGSTWPILRIIYEGLLFAKFCFSSRQTALYTRWLEGDSYLSVRRDILKKVKKPKTQELGVLWSVLCQPTHFSIYSGQPSINPDHMPTTDVIGIYAMVFVLLALNENILRRQLLSRSALYYAERYGGSLTNSLKDDRDRMKHVTAILWQELAGPGLKVIKEFTAT